MAASSFSGGEKFDNVNLLRAFAALMVVVYHVIEHGHWTTFPAAGPLLAFRIGWLGVDVFFAISGFVIAYSALILYRSAPPRFQGRYWRRRLSRIVPLYVLTIAAWLAFLSPGFFAQPPRVWGWQLFTHLAFIHSFWPETHGTIDGPNWSLAIEMQFYLAVALLIGWIDRTPGWRIWLYGIVISWAWRWWTLPFGGGDAFATFVRTTQLPGTLDEFGAGIFLAKWVLDRGKGTPREAALWLAGACVTGYIAMSLYWPRAGYWDIPGMVVFWRTALSIFLLCVVAAAVTLPQALARRWLAPLNYLGDISYGTYLWHLFAVTLVIYGLGMQGGLRALAYVLALTLLVSALSWRYFEKPLMDLARRPRAAARTQASEART